VNESLADAPMRQAKFSLPTGAVQLLLIRHGESAPVVAGAVPLRHGQADPGLDPAGEVEAHAVARRLAGEPIAAIYQSPLGRAVQTAAPLAAALGITAHDDEDLREVFLGEVDGLNLGILARAGDERVRDALREQRWDLIPGAEEPHAFGCRVRVAIDRIAERHRGNAIAVFTHGGVIGELMAQATGSTPHAFIHADNGSITHLIAAKKRLSVRCFNDTGHLRARVVLDDGRDSG
jgi:probable phosphoglycerate mutase